MIEYVIAGAVLILGGVAQIGLRRSSGEPQGGRWAGAVGYVAVGFGLVMLAAGVAGVGRG
ncbi:MAG: hypothetical protein Kow00122_10170 [Thermoleophilia bacterium]